MSGFVVRLHVPLPRETVWRRLWSPGAHTTAIPLTRVTVEELEPRAPSGSTPPGMARPGAVVVARTALGPAGLDDVMVVTRVSTPPTGPWSCTLTKVGRQVRGSVTATVEEGDGGSALVWRQRIRVAGVPGPLGPLVTAIARVAYGAALRRILDAP